MPARASVRRPDGALPRREQGRVQGIGGSFLCPPSRRLEVVLAGFEGLLVDVALALLEVDPPPCRPLERLRLLAEPVLALPPLPGGQLVEAARPHVGPRRERVPEGRARLVGPPGPVLELVPGGPARGAGAPPPKAPHDVPRVRHGVAVRELRATPEKTSRDGVEQVFDPRVRAPAVELEGEAEAVLRGGLQLLPHKGLEKPPLGPEAVHEAVPKAAPEEQEDPPLLEEGPPVVVQQSSLGLLQAPGLRSPVLLREQREGALRRKHQRQHQRRRGGLR
mmetsp:Transcript_48356/g.109874  ORF Transcript_48356/g.109874 Transcript_48356/m.109874 type:complete len:278 (-) Transcript_48356:16-849(-)